MSWPKHKNARTQNRTAHAPYNFVPLPEKVVTVNRDEVPTHDQYAHSHHTGHIACTLLTKSPLYIRGPLTPIEFRLQSEQEKKEKDGERIPLKEKIVHKPDFFYTNEKSKDDEPVIPGSSLRGMLRILVEILSYSKITTVSQQKLCYRAVADQTLGRNYRRTIANSKAGYIIKQQNGGFAIQPAEIVNGRTFFKIADETLQRHLPDFMPMYCYDKEGKLIRENGKPKKNEDYISQYLRSNSSSSDKLWFKPPQRRNRNDRLIEVVRDIATSKQGNDYFPGVIVYSGFIDGKKKHTLVTARSNSKSIKISPQLVEDYRESLTDFQKMKPFDKQNGCLVDSKPIFYLEENGKVVWFGHTPNFRIAFQQSNHTATPLDFVPKLLRKEEDIDLAEAIFGFTKKNDAYASRVFVTDARLEPDQEEIWFSEQPDHMIRPHILASPKPTAFQHYLVQTSPDQADTLKHYNSEPEQETVIRGHKLYWHKGEVTSNDIEECAENTQENSAQAKEKEDTQHTLIKPLRAGLRFHFRIYFENLSDMELGALLWALKLPGESRENYCHNLGMGKPYGMGAVKLESHLYLTDRHPRADCSGRYDKLFDDEGCWATGQISMPESTKVSIEAIKTFERKMLNEIADEEKPGSFTELERIQSLLRMLEWPGPQDRQRTEYMDLSEFRERWVLPTPLPILPRQGITRVRIKNYKSLADVDVRLGRLTILVGRNGTGKSNFIDALRFVSEGIRNLNEAITNRNGITRLRRWSPDSQTPHIVSIIINIEDDQFKGEYEIEIASDEKGSNEIDYYVSRERCSIQTENEFKEYMITKGDPIKSLPELDQVQIKDTELYLSILSRKSPFDRLYQILKELTFYTIDPELLRKPQPSSMSRMLNKNGTNLGAVLQSMQKNESERLDEVRWALGKVVEGITGVQVEEVANYFVIQFKHDLAEGLDTFFNASQESEGTLRLLGLLVALYQDRIPWLVVIEEPEKAIHPGVLALLHGVMRVTSEVRCQLIVTTHSPDLIDKASANDLRIVEMENGVTKIAPIDEADCEIIYKKLFSPGEIMRMGGFRAR